MNRAFQLVIALGVATGVGAPTAAAQSVRFGVGGGATIPLSDYKNMDNTGWHALVKADIAIPLSPVGVRVDGLYAQTDHQAPATGNTKLIGGLASVVYTIPTAAPIVKPYLLVGGGVYHVKQTFPSQPGTSEFSATKAAFAGGAGVSIGVGPVHAFAEARYTSVQTSGSALQFVPVTAGLSFGSK
jgi:Outer membrane protein beta-barrel domain